MKEILEANGKSKFTYLLEGLSWFFFLRGTYRFYTAIVEHFQRKRIRKWSEQFASLPDIPRTQEDMDRYVSSIMS
jgi:uncharacterized Fe-S cluster-containing radical SAM superfamily protein